MVQKLRALLLNLASPEQSGLFLYKGFPMFLNILTGTLAGTLTLAANDGSLIGWLGFAACILFALTAETN